MSTFTLVPRSDPESVLKANQAYLAAAWGDPARDWSAADWSGSTLFEDATFRENVRRLVMRRLRYAVRNNVYLDGLISKFPEAIGFGVLRVRTSNQEYNRTVENAWNKYAESCGVDGSSLRQLQLMKWAELPVGGEYYQVRLDTGKVQVIPTENCGSPAGYNVGADQSIQNGILRDRNGKALRYFFGTVDQNGVLTFDDVAKLGVPAEYVTHVYKRDRVSMGRGITWLISALPVAQLLFQITEGKTKQILDANSISGFIEKDGGASFVDEMAKQQTAAYNAANSTTESIPQNTNTTNANVTMANGTFVGLEKGEKIVPLISTYQAQDYNQLVMLMLHAISSPIGLPVELWFSGLGDVNYSGFKGLGTQWDGRRQSIISMVEDEDLEPHFLWWVENERRMGNLPANPDGDDMKHAWVWKATAVLDEEKKTKAAVARVEGGLTSLADEWEANGQFSDEVIQNRTNFWKALCAASGKGEVPVPIEFLMFGRVPETTPIAPSAQ